MLPYLNKDLLLMTFYVDLSFKTVYIQYKWICKLTICTKNENKGKKSTKLNSRCTSILKKKKEEEGKQNKRKEETKRKQESYSTNFAK